MLHLILQPVLQILLQTVIVQPPVQLAQQDKQLLPINQMEWVPNPPRPTLEWTLHRHHAPTSNNHKMAISNNHWCNHLYPLALSTLACRRIGHVGDGGLPMFPSHVMPLNKKEITIEYCSKPEVFAHYWILDSKQRTNGRNTNMIDKTDAGELHDVYWYGSMNRMLKAVVNCFTGTCIYSNGMYRYCTASRCTIYAAKSQKRCVTYLGFAFWWPLGV